MRHLWDGHEKSVSCLSGETHPIPDTNLRFEIIKIYAFSAPGF